LYTLDTARYMTLANLLIFWMKYLSPPLFLAISAIFATTIKPFYVLFIDTKGDTVDMAMIYKTFTAERVKDMIVDSRMSERLDHKEMIIPGFAKPLNREIERLTGWNVNIGPICCRALPLYFGEDWAAP